jgi:regulator of RNase E activity RraA
VQAQVERFSELSGPAIVVFQDLGEPSAAATFGEVMCTTYKTFGAVGLITSGTGRDLDQVRAIDFPVFTNGAICSHGYNHIPQIHVPVHVGGITVYPDDLLHGDRNGVTTIPVEIAGEVADVGYEFVAAEAVILEALRSENASMMSYADARREAQVRFGRLREQVSRAK